MSVAILAQPRVTSLPNTFLILVAMSGSVALRLVAGDRHNNAVRSLATFRRSGYDGVDEHNPDHIEAFLKMKQWQARISGPMFARHVAGMTTTVVSSAGVRSEYYGVPKTNFPDGLPESVRKSELSADDLANLELTSGGSLDTDTYFIVDCEVERRFLGKQVVTFHCSAMKTTSSAVAAAASTNPSGSERSLTDGDTPAPATATATHPSGSGSSERTPLGRGLKRTFTDPDDTEAPAEKRKRELMDALKTIRDDLLSAMDRNQWSDARPTHTNNVKYLLGELGAALEQLLLDGGHGDDLLVKILAWVTRHMTQRRAFPYLTHLKGDFSKMCELRKSTEMSDTIETIQLIESLAALDVDADAGVDFTIASVAVRTKFRGCNLYVSFLDEKVRRVIAKAHSASGAERMKLLKSCHDYPTLPTDLRDTIRVASVLFDDAVAISERLQYLTQCDVKGCLALAQHWDTHGIVGASARCMVDTPDLSDVPYDIFRRCAQLLAEIEFDPPNPIIAASCNVLNQIRDLGAPEEPWQIALGASAIVTRLAINTDAVTDHVLFKSDHVPEAHRVSCFKFMKEHLKSLSVDPEWWASWKMDVKAKLEAKRTIVNTAVAAAVASVAAAAAAAADGSSGTEPAHADPASKPKDDADASSAPKDDADASSSSLFNVGDVVVGKAVKHKSSFDGQDCKIIAVLAKHYKVTMMTGDAIGQDHKYVHNMVMTNALDAAASAPAGATEAAATSTKAAVVVDPMKQLEDLFE